MFQYICWSNVFPYLRYTDCVHCLIYTSRGRVAKVDRLGILLWSDPLRKGKKQDNTILAVRRKCVPGKDCFAGTESRDTVLRASQTLMQFIHISSTVAFNDFGCHSLSFFYFLFIFFPKTPFNAWLAALESCPFWCGAYNECWWKCYFVNR